MNIYIVLVSTIILNALANILVKIAMTNVDKTKGIVHTYLLNPFFIGAVVAFALSLASYTFVLAKMELSRAYPVIISACFMIVLGTSWLYLKENITLLQVVGVLLIISGIWLVLLK